MAAQDKATLEGLYGDGAIKYPDNTTREISPADLREGMQAQIDSAFNLIDDALSGAKGVKPGVTSEVTLKTVVTVGLIVGVHILYRDTGASNVLRLYELVAGTDAESSPDVIRPSDYAGISNEKIWKLAVVNTGTSGSWIMQGAWDASTNVVPNSGDSSVLAGYTWENGNHRSTTLNGPDGDVVKEYCTIRALVDNPGVTIGDRTKWAIIYY